jgi:hypothetical protein
MARAPADREAPDPFRDEVAERLDAAEAAVSDLRRRFDALEKLAMIGKSREGAEDTDIAARLDAMRDWLEGLFPGHGVP